ncbi:peptidoglycan D,D-transpeptidase FtsI family protein [Evansella cellulosilytica]|uniref:peptidoglycan D,D-transpeptidase FtsI family protein n=1 Tax=Evansella cellulosilytica TaxID=1413 RepID=UPI0001C2528A|nr:penicillin-binding protein 2 [Evansella cellulosilytica]
MQIVQGEEFQEQLERTINVSVPIDAPRGLMYDRYGNILVDNELQFTVTYTNRKTPQLEMIETARKLNEFVTIESRRTERDLREYWALLNHDEYIELMSIEEESELELSNAEAHTARLDRIPEEEIDALQEDEYEMQVYSLWREFNTGYNDLPHKVAQGITYEQAALIMENLEHLPGVDIIRDAERKYIYGDSLRRVFGNVGSIQRDNIDYYLANGYLRNEQVGTSYIEAQYESVLRGRNGRLENFMDQDGNFLRNPEEHVGSRGNDLVLTFDMELQQHVEKAIKDTVESERYYSQFVGDPDAYVVMMEPHTGDILAMAGYRDEANRNVLTTFTGSFEMGSAIKGATVLAGFDSGVFAPGDRVWDRTMNLSGGGTISSHTTLGSVDHLTALERSSNIYMVYVAMRLIGYSPGVSSSWGNYYRGYDILRDYYAQFGLGVPTGIDLPNESAGINGGNIPEPGRLLYLSFGQFDTYTPMQLAQYVATIANDGYRVAPRVVKEIREPSRDRNELGQISQQVEPKILNSLDMDPWYIDEVKKGFHRVTHGNQGTARSFFADRPYDAAGKTGTAQVFVDGKPANNQTFVAFAPYDNPEVAIAVVVPGISNQASASGAANTISQKVLDAYFDLKEERRGPLNWDEDLLEDEEDDEDEEESE